MRGGRRSRRPPRRVFHRPQIGNPRQSNTTEEGVMAQATEQGGTDGLTDQVSSKAQEAASAVQEKTSELREEGRTVCATSSTGDPRRRGPRRARSPRRSAGRATSWRARTTRPRSSSPPRRPTASSGSAATWSGRAGTRIFRDVEAFARQRPWMLAGLATIAGIAAARFVKASSEGRYQGNRARADAGARPVAAAGAADGSHEEGFGDEPRVVGADTAETMHGGPR